MKEWNGFFEVEINGNAFAINKELYLFLFTGICLLGSNEGVVAYIDDKSYLIKNHSFNYLISLAEEEDFQLIKILMESGLPKEYISNKLHQASQIKHSCQYRQGKS